MYLNINHWFLVSITILVLAKLFKVIELTVFGTVFIDIDRLISLFLFIAVYLKWNAEDFDYQSIKWLLIYSLFVAFLAVVLELNFVQVMALFFLTAFVEEILLRGVLYEWLMIKLSPVKTLLLSSIFFTLVHPAVYQNINYGLAILMSGFILGSIYLYFRKQSREVAVVHATGAHGLIIILGLYIEMI